MLKRLKGDLEKQIKGKVLFNEPLSKHTCLKVGGPCQVWVEPYDVDDLSRLIVIAKNYHKPLLLIGGGSNVLIRDRGFKGIAVHLGNPFFKEVKVVRNRVEAGAGVALPALISFAVSKGFGGFEYLVGIPANVGGAVAMNAGSHHEAIGTFVEKVEAVNPTGGFEILKRGDIHFSYRRSGIGSRIITRVTFNFPKVPKEETEHHIRHYSDYRRKTQDLRYASAGCAFRNPQGLKLSSGALIEKSGLKGKRIGQAQVSTIHANFIVNLGGASSRDVLKLMKLVQRQVKKQQGIVLEPEIKIV